MKILILANNDVGLYKFRRELLAEFIALGWTVNAVLPKGEFVDKIIDLGCSYTEVSMDRRGMNPLKDLKTFFKYLQIIRHEKPDAVLTYTIKPNVYGGIVCRLLRIPYFANITGLGTSIQNPGIMQKFVLALYRIGVNGACCTFFQNKDNMDFMNKHKIGSKEKCLLPGSGVDLIAHKYHEYPPETGNLVFLSIMRIMKDKGIEEFLKCAEYIKVKYPNTDFILVGDFDDNCYAETVKDASNRGIITYLGFRNDIDNLIAQCGCLINPSYHEGMSNVLLEAAACGRPVIASDIPGCKETFDECVSGFGFEVKNVDDLIACVEKFITIPCDAKEKMGIAGRKKMELEFDRKKVVFEYVNRIHQI